MARGHQKAQSQAKNAKRQEQIKKSQGHDQKKEAVKALQHQCSVCKVWLLFFFVYIKNLIQNLSRL